MKILFVGVHYKDALPALCSSTKSGKLIDRVIAELPEHKCLKTNVFSTCHLPNDHTYKMALAYSWKQVWKITGEEIVVALGGTVKLYLESVGVKVIHVPHPSSVWAKQKQEEYVTNIVNRIHQA
jgi:hypothetical protein